MSAAAQVRLEVLAEDFSMEVVLKEILPRIVPGAPYEVASFQGKDDLLKGLLGRLRGYASHWSSTGTRVVVVLDRDNDNCAELKARLLRMADDARLPREAVLFRIAVEELEAWFFGDIPALREAYPKVPPSLGSQTAFREPDAVAGGTWEALERVLRKHGYHAKGLRKARAARDIAPHMDVENNRSQSFQAFRDGLRRLVKEGN
ncbi:DUF4276 family protein [Amycolatopsis sp. NBC_00345]|uniref:DUF4276 family protein n=1 Tax=Amycolatopsis sp. NBC_00345 TaxID=2975955 RepID=UPI002E25666A